MVLRNTFKAPRDSTDTFSRLNWQGVNPNMRPRLAKVSET